MQNDLIDRSELIKVLSEKYSGLSDTREEYDFAMYTAFKQIIRLIKNQPIAYDVEKVVAELEKLDEDDRCDNVPQNICDKMKTCKYCRTQGLIKIVRNGGKD